MVGEEKSPKILSVPFDYLANEKAGRNTNVFYKCNRVNSLVCQHFLSLIHSGESEPSAYYLHISCIPDLCVARISEKR